MQTAQVLTVRYPYLLEAGRPPDCHCDFHFDLHISLFDILGTVEESEALFGSIFVLFDYHFLYGVGHETIEEQTL